MLHLSDEFILFDDMQYTRRDWRNRNVIKSPSRLTWLTIPVAVKGRYFQSIKETVVSDQSWNEWHWKTIVHCYSRAPCFAQYKGLLEDLYLGTSETHLSLINYRFLQALGALLGINTKITWSMSYQLVGEKTERLVGLCEQAQATEYLTGPAAKTYLDEDAFARRGIRVKYMDYSGYPEYGQLYPPFEPKVSILDLILNEGPNACKFMKSF